MIEDVIAQSRRHIVELEPESCDEVRDAGQPIVGFSAAMARGRPRDQGFPLSAALPPRPHHADHGRGRGGGAPACSPITSTTPGDLPAEWLGGLDPADAAGRALRIADFIAGMTDRYAMVEHARMFGATPELR